MIRDETAKEAAKAVQEVAKTATAAIELAGKAGAFVAKIIGKSTEEIGGILVDTIGYYRQKNLLAIEEKLNAIRAKRNIREAASTLHPRLAVPILEAASLEDDDTLQEIWARLIVNATNVNYKQHIHPGFIEMVKQLSPDEAMILQTCANLQATLFVVDAFNSTNVSFAYYPNGDMAKGRVTHFIDLKSPRLINTYLDNLYRLRIIEPTSGGLNNVTSFGQNFMAACIADPD